MTLILFLQSHLIITLVLTALIGLVIGSFLNVAIYRYPIMLHNQWRAECLEFLNMPPEKDKPAFNLALPRSHCPHCKHTITFWQNIPLLSYLFLLGKCAHCQKAISPLYFMIELLSAVLACLVVWTFGITTQTAFALIFTWALIAMSAIDFHEHLLPDDLTLSLLWVGLFSAAFNIFTTPKLAILGALVGYLVLWGVAKLFKAIRQKDGMGFGDFKMLAMLGAWVGINALLNVLLTAVILALVVSIPLLFLKKLTKGNPIPFGPFLAVAGWTTLMFGQPLMDALIRWVQ